VSLTKAAKSNQSATFFIGNRFHVTLRVLNSEICKQCLQEKSWKAKARAKKASTLKTEIHKWKPKLRQQKNWKVHLSQIVAFAKIGKLSDAKYRATNWHWQNHAAVTQNRALVECASSIVFVSSTDVLHSQERL